MAAKKETSTFPEELLSRYDQLIKNLPGVERKGVTMPYTSLNGNMFSFLTKEGTLALRLSAEDLAECIKKHNTSLCEAHGTVLKEYVVIPDKLLKDTKEIKKYFQKSFDYVGSLKPKPTKKSAPKGINR